MLAAHVDHAEIGVCSSGLRIKLKHLTEIVLGFVQLAFCEGFLPVLKKLRGTRGLACSVDEDADAPVRPAAGRSRGLLRRNGRRYSR